MFTTGTIFYFSMIIFCVLIVIIGTKIRKFAFKMKETKSKDMDLARNIKLLIGGLLVLFPVVYISKFNVVDEYLDVYVYVAVVMLLISIIEYLQYVKFISEDDILFHLYKWRRRVGSIRFVAIILIFFILFKDYLYLFFPVR